MNIYPSVMATTQKQANLLFKKLEGVTKYVHLDVADKRFVPTTSFWFPFRLSSKFSYAAHLMVDKPLQWIKQHGHRVSIIIFHPEAKDNIQKTIAAIKQKKKKVGFALKPETPVSIIKPYLNDLDYILILTVHPGYYGAKFLKSPLKKIQQVKKLQPHLHIIVDGGMDPTTVPLAKHAGADAIISGHFVTQAENPKKAVHELKKSLK